MNDWIDACDMLPGINNRYTRLLVLYKELTSDIERPYLSAVAIYTDDEEWKLAWNHASYEDTYPCFEENELEVMYWMFIPNAPKYLPEEI